MLKMKSLQYMEKNKQRFLDELFDLLRIPSVSTDSNFASDIKRAAKFLKEKFEIAGVDFAEINETARHPIVYAEKIIDPSKPTILVYGHYDVQPADPYELWDSPPFEPVIKNNKIYARGACDDKGQMYMHIKSFEAMMAEDELPCNVKFIIEGEEEIGSNNLGWFLANNKEKLKADVILISDTGIINNNTPSMPVGLRGLSNVEIEVMGPNRDLHSGLYGGAVSNPINTLCDMISSLVDDKGHITIPGFYDRVLELTREERTEMAKVPFNLKDYKKELDIAEVKGEDGFTTLERLGIRPSLDVNGIWGGYTGEGPKTVLPSLAYAKISTRLVPNQRSDEITKLISEHLINITPKHVKIKITPYHGAEAAIISTNSDGYRTASKAFTTVWGKAPIPIRDGASIPIVSLFKDELGLDSVMLGFGLDEDAIHSPNESYGIFNYFKGIETIIQFYKFYSEVK